MTAFCVYTCCSELLVRNNPCQNRGELLSTVILWSLRKTVCLAWGGGLHKHGGFLGAERRRRRQSLCICVCGEESTITKMHWLKLDPYRYQTESWSRQADATRQCECNTHRQPRTRTHHNCVLINARGRRKVITFVCISGSDYWSDSKVRSLGPRLLLLSLPTTTLQATSHPVCLSVCCPGWVQRHTNSTDSLWAADAGAQILKLIKAAWIIFNYAAILQINVLLFELSFKPIWLAAEL